MIATTDAVAPGPVILGINRGRDASACLMQGARVVWAIQKERLTRQRHARGRAGDVRDHYGPRLPWPERPVDVVVECSSLDADGPEPAPGADELAATLRLAPGYRRARISHHLAHAAGVFHPSPFRAAAVLVVGGQGSTVADLADHWSGAGYVPDHWCEVASFYRADRERMHCIGKQLWDRDGAHPVGLGMFYALLTQALFPGDGNEGKVMDLAPHGDPHALGLPPLTVDAGQASIPPAWRALLQDGERFRHGQPGVAFADSANLAAAGQRAFEEALLAVARWLHAETGLDYLCCAGGAALNGAANARLLRETPFRHVFIPPAPGAAGTALGCALYGLTDLAGASDAYRWTHDYLGPRSPLQAVEAALARAGDLRDLRVLRLADPDAMRSHLLDLLCSGRVLALYQGGSEFGPHALGHRSILADPRSSAMRDWINAYVKGREWFRPLAAAMLAERAADYVDLPAHAATYLPSPSPFMQYAAPVRPAMAARIPACTRVDGSTRLQTVSATDDALLRGLLTGFEARTGVPVLLNTAFHGKDEPLVETPDEALASFRRMPLHALAMPPFLVTKQVEPGLPA